jgi:fatty acid desaturase
MSIEMWWRGKARSKLSDVIRHQVAAWQREAPTAGDVKQFDAAFGAKLAAWHIGCLSCFVLYHFVPSVWVAIPSVMLMGFLFIPAVRSSMHFQFHWGIGRNPLSRFIMDHLSALPYSVPQTGYVYGHRAHHQFDNDFDERGIPKDMQSTFCFSKDGRPTAPVLWVLYYIFVYQHFVHAWCVASGKRFADIASYALELAAIVGVHLAIYGVDAKLYLRVYLPALALAWLASATTLYMQHAVDAHDYSLHPTNNCLSKFFNAVSLNDGYHLEHSLFPGLHPAYLEKVHQLIGPQDNQVFHSPYTSQYFASLFAKKRAVIHSPSVLKKDTAS